MCVSFYLKVIRPSITYAVPVWGSVRQTELFKSLERQHCRGTRIIFGLPSDMPTADVLATLKDGAHYYQGSRARRERNAQHAGHADWFCLL